KGQKGPPPEDPFAPDVDSELAATVEARFSQAPSTTSGSAIAFESIRELDDAALADGMRELLRQTARAGASDLHLSTGSRPFTRTNRKLAFLSDHVLTDTDALRLNTALLSSAQNQIFQERKDYDYALALSA